MIKKKLAGIMLMALGLILGGAAVVAQGIPEKK